MQFETIRIESDERGVATLTMARPDKHNSLSDQMIVELTRAAEILGTDKKIRVVVMTGEGKSFCAGGDLDSMRKQAQATREGRIADARKLAEMLRALNELPKPLIGRVNGQAYGGGLGMMCVCDMAVAVDSAKFGFTEPRLGLIPATISPYCVARMGEGLARRVIMSARLFDTVEAKELNLIARAVAADELDLAIENEVIPYLACAPEAVAETKALARALGPVIDEATMEMTLTKLADVWETPQVAEGIAAFFEKRAPAWKR